MLRLDQCVEGVCVKVVRLRVPIDVADPLAVAKIGKCGAVAKLLPESADPYRVQVKFTDRMFPLAFSLEELELETPYA